MYGNMATGWISGRKKKRSLFLVGIVTKMHGKNDIERNSTKFN